MELFFEVLHVYSNSLVLLLVIIVNISFAGYSGFEWLKLKHMTNWASQCVAAKSDYLEVFEASTIMVLW